MHALDLAKMLKHMRRTPSYHPENGAAQTIFVLSGGGALGAAQAGMLLALINENIIPEL